MTNENDFLDDAYIQEAYAKRREKIRHDLFDIIGQCTKPLHLNDICRGKVIIDYLRLYFIQIVIILAILMMIAVAIIGYKRGQGENASQVSEKDNELNAWKNMFAFTPL